MGLERLACVMQGVDNMFEVDTVRNILNKVCEISGKEYGKDKNTDISIRAITDHARASTFMISDGIIPSNEGRGYVLRRLIRRAARHGRLIGIDKPFLKEMCEAVIAENKSGYPELVEKQELIKKVISNEEASFSKTIDQGLGILNELTKKGGTLSGEDAFKLYDTYGFPFDLTKDILAEKGMSVDEDGFNEHMQRQRELARSSRKASDGESWSSDGINFDNIPATEFLGYSENSCEAEIVDIVCDGEHCSNATNCKAVIVLDKTVCYAESGGQVGDRGTLCADKSDNVFFIEDTKKTTGGVFTHQAVIVNGSLSVGDKVTVSIDVKRRNAIRRNHTAAHLLQAALRKVLGTHVEQAGQLVNEKSVRFDFTHFSALTSEEIEKVECLVNTAILDGIAVDNREMPIDEAKSLGAMALFGEKYGDIVRVVKAGEFSTELCGGTHVDNTAKIGLFRIVSESGIAAGTRRIEALTGFAVVDLIDHYKSLLCDTASVLKIGNIEDVASKTAATVKQMKEDSKKIEALEAKLASGKLNDIMASAADVGGIKVVTAKFDGTSPDELRKMIDTVKGDNDNAVAVLASVNGEKLTFCAGVGKAALSRGAHAGNIVKAVAQIAGGNGGGKPDSAMAGGKEIAKADEALSAVQSIVEGMIN